MRKLAIEFSADVLMTLDVARTASRGREYSGIGWGEWDDGRYYVYDFRLLNVGSEGFTEIDEEVAYELSQKENHGDMRIWIHEHPLGNGVPGAHNWSDLDEYTCTQMPMGSPYPQLVKWSFAAVHTPGGWVGRFDNHIEHKTNHLLVYPEPSISVAHARMMGYEYQKQIKRERMEAMLEARRQEAERVLKNKLQEELIYEDVEEVKPSSVASRFLDILRGKT